MSEQPFWERVEKLGASAGATGEAMRKWRERGGVPGSWHLPLLKLARETEVPLTEEELLSTTKRTVAA